MPFVALDKSTKERIDITKIENPRSILKSGEVICQLCESPMIVKAGLIVRPHFAHYAQCESDYEHHPESPEHLLGKELISNSLKAHFPDYADADIQLEVKIPEVKRVADIMVTFQNGWQQAHEIQLAAITVENLQKRTEDYHRAGVDIVWYLGGNADTETNRTWCTNYFGFCFRFEITKRVVDANFWEK